jgi:hypothetical protein
MPEPYTSSLIRSNWLQNNGKQVYMAKPWHLAYSKLQNACQGTD